MQVSFPCSRCSSLVTESISIPRNMTTVKGHSSFATAIVSPSSAHSGTATSKALLHAVEVGGIQKESSTEWGALIGGH